MSPTQFSLSYSCERRVSGLMFRLAHDSFNNYSIEALAPTNAWERVYQIGIVDPTSARRTYNLYLSHFKTTMAIGQRGNPKKARDN